MENSWSRSDLKMNIEDHMDNAPCAMDGEMIDNGEIIVIQGYKDEYVENCWHKFTRCIRSIWATKQTEDLHNDKKRYINTTIRELVIYSIFLATLIIITFGMRDGTMYWFSNLLSTLFLKGPFIDNSGSFSGMSADSDFWKFLMGPFMYGLYWNTWYNGNNLTNNDLNSIFYENKLLGIPRLRQVRVQNNSCINPISFLPNQTACYAEYSASTESKDSYGPQNSTAFIYTNGSTLTSQSFQGIISTYGAGGFYVDLSNNQLTSLSIILSLYNNMWIDRATRAVIVDFTVYNANINLFCVIKLVGEFPPTGGVLPSYEFRTVKLIRYLTAFDYFVLACEIIFVLFLLYYIIEEAIEIAKHKMLYFFVFWNFLDIFVLGICILCTIFNIYRTMAITNILNNLLANQNQHPTFEQLSFLQIQYDYLTAFTVFLVTIKIFKYISFNKMMTQLIATLNYCLKDLIGFSFMFFIIFLAFAQVGCLLFGSQLANFRQFHICIYTQFRIILNDCNFQELRQVNSVLGPIYFILYVVFVFFILFNMFLAILDDAYGDVKEQMEEEENEFEITDFLKEKTKMMLSKLNLKREKLIGMQNAMTRVDKNNDGVMDFDEWKEELKSRGYEDGEIEALFVRYDTDGDRVLNEKEQLDMLKELNEQKTTLDKEFIEHTGDLEKLIPENTVSLISIGRYHGLCRRVDMIDEIIGKLSMKFEIIVEKFQNMEKTKNKIKATMENIMNVLTSVDGQSEEERKEIIEEILIKEINILSDNGY